MEITFSGRVGRSEIFFFFFYSYTLSQSQSPKQNMHSKWWQPNCQSNFLAVKPKTEGFNTILTTKLNDDVLIMASFETNNSKNWSLNTKKKKKKKKIPTQLLQDFGSVGKGQHNIFFLGLTASWSTFEGMLMVLYSYCMHCSSCRSSCRVPLKEFQIGVATGVCFVRDVRGQSEESRCVFDLV